MRRPVHSMRSARSSCQHDKLHLFCLGINKYFLYWAIFYGQFVSVVRRYAAFWSFEAHIDETQTYLLFIAKFKKNILNELPKLWWPLTGSALSAPQWSLRGCVQGIWIAWQTSSYSLKALQELRFNWNKKL